MAEQFRLPLLNTSAPPQTRADCGQLSRPCNRYSCRHHMWPETERAGRPHYGRRPPPKLFREGESCVLDIVATNPDGMELKSIAGHMHVVRERVRQIEERALSKVRVANAVLDMLEPIRQALSEQGIRLDVEYPQSSDVGAVQVLLIIGVDQHRRALKR